MKENVLSLFTLFTSVGTLVCCALPALLVTVGFGAAVAGLLTAAPWLVSLSHYKAWIFAFGGIMIVTSFLFHYRKKTQPVQCGIHATEECRTASRLTPTLLWVSLSIYGIGFFMSYLYLPIRLFLENR